MPRYDRTVSDAIVKYRFKRLNNGVVYESTKNFKVFQMFGRFWINNKRRSKMYKMDDCSWKPKEYSMFTKLLWVIGGDFKSVK